MKKWFITVIIVLVLTNALTLTLFLLKKNELAYTQKTVNTYAIPFSGSGDNWSVKDGLFVVTPSMYMVKGGTLSYSGDKTLKIKQINMEMALKKKDGSIDEALASGENYENTEPEVIKKGYSNELPSSRQAFSVKDFKEWKKNMNNQPMDISILYTTEDGKEHKSEILTIIN